MYLRPSQLYADSMTVRNNPVGLEGMTVPEFELELLSDAYSQWGADPTPRYTHTLPWDEMQRRLADEPKGDMRHEAAGSVESNLDWDMRVMAARSRRGEPIGTYFEEALAGPGRADVDDAAFDLGGSPLANYGDHVDDWGYGVHGIDSCCVPGWSSDSDDSDWGRRRSPCADAGSASDDDAGGGSGSDDDDATELPSQQFVSEVPVYDDYDDVLLGAAVRGVHYSRSAGARGGPPALQSHGPLDAYVRARIIASRLPSVLTYLYDTVIYWSRLPSDCRLPDLLRANYPPEATRQAWAVCPDLDVLYSFDPADSSREIARRYGKLEASVDGRRLDVWDTDHADHAAPPLPEEAPAPVRRACRRGRPRKRAAGGVTLTPLLEPVGVDGPPPHAGDFPPNKAGRSLFVDARSCWFEGYTGVPLQGTPLQQHEQFHEVTRSFRHDARGRASRPSPRKVPLAAAGGPFPANPSPPLLAPLTLLDVWRDLCL